ncbi:glycosyltransferase family A protein [Sphingomonas sp.]|uniref:glycosyltransferase family 2 protein n=1 Tax=Sphingomonas sp. TaxID=28214 RepID=UPI0025F06EFC|nr:glycosyltransferase family A protein [Sphingomonas sp.]MBV9526811.1 glycosyltransferase family 2 protein [Sphingomonas sp.]
MSPKVSIVTAYRNAAAYLRQAIESVLAQSVGEWELLLVDDRSTDHGPDIAADYARLDKRIRLLSTTPGRTGAAAARNLGLEQARGEFVAFLDADDLLVPDKLECELALASEHPDAALITGAARWWHPGREQADWIDAVQHVATGAHQPPALLNDLILLNRDEVPCICAVLVRRDAVRAVGGFEERLALYEDQSLWVKLFARYPAVLGRHLTSIYRQHDQSTSAAAEGSGDYHRMRVHPARAEFLDWTERYLGNEGRLGPSRRALRIARALVSGSLAGLTPGERLGYLGLRIERLRRRVAARLRHSGRGKAALGPVIE